MIPGRKHARLMFHGYTFKRYQVLVNGHVRWRCSKWHMGCRVSVKTNTEDPRAGILLIENIHNHERPTLVRNNEVYFLATKKKYPLLLFDKYTFKRQSILTSGGVIWYCSNRHYGCKAQVKSIQDSYVFGKIEHNHDPPRCTQLSNGTWIRTRKMKKYKPRKL
ncbi:hypothetical protein RR46_00552 [Papilio xuthus]|uniref:FLYWCH-type domain-containing protein n=1 Tax=Papilio xuthus TaxID=66420 RepID=A0A0N0PAB3_PAPXU|nr:hypothetical protein RR46_00552 [Papilio xuthus]